jgi:glycosyltransferase involved in cell wall biosynthesis
MKRKKVFFITEHLRMGGAEKVLIEVLQTINIKKYDIRLFIENNDGENNFFEKDIPKNIPYTFLKSENWTRLSQKKMTKSGFQNKLYQKIVYNLFIKHIDTLFVWIYLILISRIYSIDILIDFNTNYTKHISFIAAKKKIGWLHHSILHAKKEKEKINTFGKRITRYDTLVAVSKEMQEELALLYPFIQEKLVFLYNPFHFKQIQTIALDLSVFKIDGKRQLQEKYFIAVSRLETASKDYYTLLQAVQILKKRGIQEKLYIVGDGSDREKIEGWIQEMDLTDQVKLLGLQKNPYVWMKNAQFLVHSSKSEGLPTVLIEAMILGKYVISSDCPTGPKEILENGRIGTLVKVGDAVGFANAIEYQIKNPASAEMLGKIEKSIQRFEASNVMKEYEKIIDL